jgi:hypothetical protein
MVRRIPRWCVGSHCRRSYSMQNPPPMCRRNAWSGRQLLDCHCSVVGSRACVSEFLREDNSPAFQPGGGPTSGHFETSSQQRPVLCAASIHLVLDASLPRALCAVSTAPPTSLTRRRCPCPRLRLVSCHPLQVLRRDNRPKPKSHRYYSIPIGDPKE